MMEEEEEELLRLRIQALKSSREKQSERNSSAVKNELKPSNTQDDDEVALRNIALNSIHNIISADSKQRNNENITGKPNLADGEKNNSTVQPVDAADKGVEELFLREKALKTLLQKRVVKTQKMIKEAIQNEKVSSTSNASKKPPEECRINTSIEENNEQPARKRQPYRNPNLLKSTELRNFLSVVPRDNKENNESVDDKVEDELTCSTGRLHSVQIDSDDQLSICASDDEERDKANKKPTHENITDVSSTQTTSEIQCNIVSSCCEKDEESTIFQNGNEVLSKTFTKTVEPKIEEVVDDEKPGPSGYIKPSDYTENDSTDESIVEINPPNEKHPRVLNLISDFDSDSANPVSHSGKGKQKKKKKRTVKEQLSRQEGVLDGDREDLKDLTCSICLGPFENRTFLKECFHSFCQICIMQWSELSRLCPLCKTFYRTLIHSVTKDLEFEEYTFPKKQPSDEKKQAQRNQFSEVMDDGRRFRYSSTVVDSATWAQRRQERERAENQRATGREQRKISRRLRWSATKDRRKAVYKLKMIIKEVKQRGRTLVRDISPRFFKDNPAIKHRLVPWLLRDLNVLLGNDDEMIRFVMSLILNLIPKISMDSEEFKQQLVGFLYDKTSQFVDELVSFARSPYDIRGYDNNVVYDVPPTVIESDNEENEETIEKKILHEVFLADQQNKPLLNTENTISSPEKSDASGSRLEDTAPNLVVSKQNHVKECITNGSPSVAYATDTEAIKTDEAGNLVTMINTPITFKETGDEESVTTIKELQQNESESDHDDSNSEGKSVKKKKKKKKKRKNDNQKDQNDKESETVEIRSDDFHQTKKKKKKKKHKHSHKNVENESETEYGSKKSIDSKKFENSENKKLNIDKIEKGTVSSEEIERQKTNGREPLSDDDTDTVTRKRKSRKCSHSSLEPEKHKNKSNKKRKRKKGKSHKKSRDDDDVTHRLYKFLGSDTCPSAKQEQNISRLNEQLQKYVEAQNDNERKNKTMMTQSEIITELLAVEKALLRSQRKKEIVRLRERQAGLEETRSKRRRAGDPSYNENDAKIYRIDDELEKLFQQMEKS